MDAANENEKVVFYGMVLEKPCPDCKGASVIQNPAWAMWWKNHHTPPPEGHWMLDLPEEIGCPACDGVGYVPTELGERLLAFLKRHRP